MRKIIILITILISSLMISKAQTPPVTNSQTGIIVGNITDNGLHNPVEYANVVLYQVADSLMITGTISDASGNFFLKEVPFGNYYLKADFIGYNSQIINDIKLSSDNKFYKIDTIYLVQSSTELGEVEIVAVKDYIQYEIDKKVVNVSQHPNAAGGSAADVLENTPSVTVDMDGNVSLRGSTNFTVLIDGKPTVLDGNDVLQQTPSDMIESIEIITNPSAKYDPDGTSGIINIILKDDIETGINGIINASYGTWNKYSTDFLFNYRTKKINFFVGADYKDTPRNADFKSEREDYYNDTTEFIYSEGERGHSHGGYSAKGGFDVFLNDNNTLSFSGTAGKFIFGLNNEYYYTNWTNPETSKEFFITSGLNEINSDYYTGDISYQLKLPEDQLDIYFYYANRIGGSTEGQSEIFTDSQWEALDYGSFEHKSVNEEYKKSGKFKIDYTKTLTEESKFEAGYSGELNYTDFDFIYQDFDFETDQWIINQIYTNDYSFSKNIQAVYSTLSGKLAGFGYLAGLRAEYTNRLFTQITLNEEYPFEKFSLFPSAYLVREFGTEQQIQLNYSRRIDRPQEWFLNPFPMYSDQYTVMLGNPNLEPQYTNSYELNYQKSFGMSFVSLETFYRKTDNAMNRYTELQEDGRLAQIFENITSETNIGAEIMGNFTLMKIMMLNPSFSIYQYTAKGEVESVDKTQKSLNYNARLSAMFFLSRTTKLQIMSFYNSKIKTLQGEMKGNIGVMASVKQELFKKKLTLTLSARNALGTMKWEFSSAGEGYSVYNQFVPEFPMINFSISYKINNYTKKTFETENQEIQIDGF